MSYRELRNFTEMMRSLGYSRLISMENFRRPNFPLVAEILVWLAKRFDPSADISNEISTVNDRILLIRSVAHLLALKANLKLNTKKLYQADGYAVKELIKVTTCLCDALKIKQTSLQENDDEIPVVSRLEISLKVDELKNNRFLVGEVTAKGAALFELLASEPDLRVLRNSRASRHLEMSQVETAVKDSIKAVEREIVNIKQQMESVAANEATLDSKIEKKTADLQRHQKRLQTLNKVRPAFMEEFENLEEELKVLYTDYITKFRNLTYLEHVLEQNLQAEQKRLNQKQDATKKLLEDLRQEDGASISNDLYHDITDEEIKPNVGATDRARHRTGNRTRNVTGTRRVFGSMTAGDDDTDTLDESDSDLLLDGDVTEDDDLDLHKKQLKDISDDDF